MFRAKDVILYKKIRFRFSSERFVDIPKKSIKCIFAYLSFLGKLLKEFRHDEFFWLKITKGIQAWKVCCTNHGFWCAWGVHIPLGYTRSTKSTFSEDIFQKKVEKNIWIPNFEIDQISEFCLKTDATYSSLGYSHLQFRFCQHVAGRLKSTFVKVLDFVFLWR